MSTIDATNIVIGNSATADNNFKFNAPDDGTLTLKTAGGTRTVLTVDAAGKVAIPNNIVPAFSVYSNAPQTITTSTWTDIAFQVEEYDTNSNFDTATYKFTPTVAGYYQVSGAVYVSTATTFLGAAIYKNGASFKQGSSLTIAATTNSNAYVSCLVKMNGSTDYITLRGHAVGTTPSTLNSSNVTYFQGVLVRAA